MFCFELTKKLSRIQTENVSGGKGEVLFDAFNYSNNFLDETFFSHLPHYIPSYPKNIHLMQRRHLYYFIIRHVIVFQLQLLECK